MKILIAFLFILSGLLFLFATIVFIDFLNESRPLKNLGKKKGKKN